MEKVPVKNQQNVDDFQRMYDELMDPDKRQEARQREERKLRIAAKRADTGI